MSFSFQKNATFLKGISRKISSFAYHPLLVLMLQNQKKGPAGAILMTSTSFSYPYIEGLSQYISHTSSYIFFVECEVAMALPSYVSGFVTGVKALRL